MARARFRLSLRARALAVVVVVTLCIACLVLRVRDKSDALPPAATGAPSAGDTQVVPQAIQLPSHGQEPIKHDDSVIRIRVIDEGQAPIEGASVGLQESLSQGDTVAQGSRPATATVKTNAEGRCDLIVRTEGPPYVVVASAPGFRAETREILLRGADLQEVTFVLTAELGPDECRVSGIVVDQHGKGLPNVEVMALHDYPTGGCVVSRRTNQDGAFSVGGLKPGECRLEAIVHVMTADGRRRSLDIGVDGPLAVFDLQGGEHRKGVRIVLAKYSLSGQVRNERGAPVGQALVVARQGGLFLAESQSEKGGSFTIAEIILRKDETVVNVDCTAKGYEPTRLTGIPLDTTNLDIVLQPAARGAIRGRVYDALTRHPVSGARVAAPAGKSGSGERWGEELSEEVLALTDPQGMFALDNVRAGAVYLLIHAESYGLRELRVDVARDRTTEVDIPLSRAGILKVSLTRKDTKELPITALQFWCYPSGQRFDAHGLGMSLQYLLRGQMDPDPYFAVHDGDELHLAPGEYDIASNAVSEGSLETPDGTIRYHSTHAWLTRVVVESGQTTELRITLGGPSYVLISAKPRQPHSFVMEAHMVPADGLDSVEVFGPDFLRTRDIIWSYPERYSAQTSLLTLDPGNTVWICIPNVKPGAYRLGIYERWTSRQADLRGASVIHVPEDGRCIVELE